MVPWPCSATAHGLHCTCRKHSPIIAMWQRAPPNCMGIGCAHGREAGWQEPHRPNWILPCRRRDLQLKVACVKAFLKASLVHSRSAGVSQGSSQPVPSSAKSPTASKLKDCDGGLFHLTFTYKSCMVDSRFQRSIPIGCPLRREAP